MLPPPSIWPRIRAFQLATAVFFSFLLLSSALEGGQLSPSLGEGAESDALQDPADGVQDPEIAPFVRPLELEQEVALSRGARPYLAQAMARASRRLVTRSQPELVHLDLAFAFSGFAVELQDDEIECWRLRLAMASASDPDDPVVREAEADALEAISRLDPQDSVIRLRRILHAVEQVQTVEGRLKRFEQLLEPASVELIGRDVAARLALDMALLLSRSGDTEGFARRLLQAVELDPFFPQATAMAAGYFADGEPVNDAELLMAALLADPLELGFAVQLGELALQHGAFKSASRLLSVAVASARSAGRLSDGLAVQYALAVWGEGRSEDALEILASRMRDRDAVSRTDARAAKPSMTSMEVMDIRASETPRISMLKGAILSEGSDTKVYREYVGQVTKELQALLVEVTESFEQISDQDVEALDSDQRAEFRNALFEKATILLESAAFIGWHVEDASQLRSFIDTVTEITDLDPTAVSRFDAWGELALGRTEKAISLLEPLAGDDDLAALALSIAYARSNRMSDAARLWLRLARETPGTIIGIWCRNRLEKELEITVAPSPVADTIDGRIATLPASFDRILLGRDDAYSLRVTPVKSTIQPFADILFNLEIENRSGLRLSVGPDGPLLPTMGLVATTTTAKSRSSSTSKTMVFPIDRILGIDSRESLSVDCNMNYHPVGEVAVARAGEGLTIALRAVTNFDSDGSMVVPGRFGESVVSRLMRVDGITPDTQYRRDAMDLIMEMNGVDSLNALILLLEIGLRVDPAGETEESALFRRGIISIFLARYDQLPSHARAWLAYLLPMSRSFPEYQEVVATVMGDSDEVVQQTLLAKMTWAAADGGSRNPTLELLAGSPHEEVAAMAKGLQTVWSIAELEESAAEAAQALRELGP